MVSNTQMLGGGRFGDFPRSSPVAPFFAIPRDRGSIGRGTRPVDRSILGARLASSLGISAPPHFLAFRPLALLLGLAKLALLICSSR